MLQSTRAASGSLSISRTPTPGNAYLLPEEVGGLSPAGRPKLPGACRAGLTWDANRVPRARVRRPGATGEARVKRVAGGPQLPQDQRSPPGRPLYRWTACPSDSQFYSSAIGSQRDDCGPIATSQNRADCKHFMAVIENTFLSGLQFSRRTSLDSNQSLGLASKG